MSIDWIQNKILFSEPESFHGKKILIGSSHSFICGDISTSYKDIGEFSGFKMLERFVDNNIIFILLEGKSLEEAKILQSRFIVEGMYNSDTGDSGKYVTYHITVKLPDNSCHKFKQIVKT
jgi:hypothetical protein